MIIPVKGNIKTITDLREDALGLLKEVEKRGLVYVFQHSDPKAVMLSVGAFSRLMERLEDQQDEADARALSEENRGEGIPLKRITAAYGERDD